MLRLFRGPERVQSVHIDRLRRDALCPLASGESARNPLAVRDIYPVV